MWKSDIAIHQKHRLNNTKNILSKLKPLNFNVHAMCRAVDGEGWLGGDEWLSMGSMGTLTMEADIGGEINVQILYA